MKKYLKETTALALYAGLLLEASEVLRSLGPEVDHNLKRLILGLHQKRQLKADFGMVSQIEKVAWRDVKDRGANIYNGNPGIAIALVGKTGAAMVFPNGEEWIAYVVGNDSNIEKMNGTSVNAMMPDIKNVMGKPGNLYQIRYKAVKPKPSAAGIATHRSLLSMEKFILTLAQTLRPYIQKKATKARAELNSRIQVMVSNDVDYSKISKKVKRKALIKNYLKNPTTYQALEEKLLTDAIVSTVSYYVPEVDIRPNSTGHYNLSPLVYVDNPEAKEIVRKISEKDREVLATLMYFIERAWLRINN